MKRRKYDADWRPRPGSWEEAVVPYEEQRAHMLERMTTKPRLERRLESAPTPSPISSPTPRIPASL